VFLYKKGKKNKKTAKQTDPSMFPDKPTQIFQRNKADLYPKPPLIACARKKRRNPLPNDHMRCKKFKETLTQKTKNAQSMLKLNRL
jgi:hypothetical protein